MGAAIADLGLAILTDRLGILADWIRFYFLGLLLSNGEVLLFFFALFTSAWSLSLALGSARLPDLGLLFYSGWLKAY